MLPVRKGGGRFPEGKKRGFVRVRKGRKGARDILMRVRVRAHVRKRIYS